jgi:translation initiation factor RLI1
VIVFVSGLEELLELKEKSISGVAHISCYCYCGCLQKCPFEAIQIINLPKDLDKDTTHRYGPNTFKLHR